jgi:peptidoglycan/xylan/chitin deacetylase (PgdA/CDA1 family)
MSEFMKYTCLILCSLLFFNFNLTNAQEKSIAITIDDLPLNGKIRNEAEYIEITNRLLTHLNNHNIQAVGFVNEGKMYVNSIAEIHKIAALELWLNKGQELGNHTFSHPSLNKVSLESYLDDIMKGEKIIRELLQKHNKPLRYFRHPFLHTGRSLDIRDSVTAFLNSKNYTVAPVSIDNSEWIYASAYEKAYLNKDTSSMKFIITSYIPYMTEKLKFFESQSEALFGYNIKHILLLHANRLNADAMGELFNAIAEEGYSYITLEEALTDKAYLSEDTFTGAGGISWLHRWALTMGKTKEFFAGENKVPQEILKLSGVESE